MAKERNGLVVGDRVQVVAHETRYRLKGQRERFGVVTAFSLHPQFVLVQWDGRKTSEGVDALAVERVAASAAQTNGECMMATMVETFRSFREVGVPLVAVSSVDQFETVAALAGASPEKAPLVKWDAASGMVGVNKPGALALQAVKPEAIKPEDTYAFADAMVAARKLPTGTVVFAYNAHRQLHSQEPSATAQAVQAVANLRDEFKQDYRMLVLLGPSAHMPPELKHDVMVLDHGYPSQDELRTVVSEVHATAIDTMAAVAKKTGKKPTVELKPLEDAVRDRAVDAVSGLSMFSSEQTTAVALTTGRLDVDSMWDRKRVAIEATDGLRVHRGRETFADIVGLDALKERGRRIKAGRMPVGVVVVIEEIDKAWANVEGDTTGTRTDQVQLFLNAMEDNEWRGLCNIGPGGGGKSLFGKAFGNECGVPTVYLDLGALLGQYVGTSEEKARKVLDVIKAIGRGNAFIVATSNGATAMRPELQNRFSAGMWYVDLMTEAQRKQAFAHYLAKYELGKQPLPDASGWSGREIRNCCRDAWSEDCTVVEAAKSIVPMSQQRPEELVRVRRLAHGRLLDATHGGAFRYDPEHDAVATALEAKVLRKIGSFEESIDPKKVN